MRSGSIYYFLLIVLYFFIACKKEYSYEGGRTPVLMDTGVNNIPKPYSCSSCVGADNYIEGKWSFYNGASFYCGDIDTAIATQTRNGFTFFGPSSCSTDSGFVITIIIDPQTLTKDQFYLTTNNVGMYYYDHIGYTYPFMSQAGAGEFSLTIDSYIHQTRLMTGRFGGKVFLPNGDSTTLSGKYKLKIP